MFGSVFEKVKGSRQVGVDEARVLLQQAERSLAAASAEKHAAETRLADFKEQRRILWADKADGQVVGAALAQIETAIRAQEGRLEELGAVEASRQQQVELRRGDLRGAEYRARGSTAREIARAITQKTAVLESALAAVVTAATELEAEELRADDLRAAFQDVTIPVPRVGAITYRTAGQVELEQLRARLAHARAALESVAMNDAFNKRQSERLRDLQGPDNAPQVAMLPRSGWVREIGEDGLERQLPVPLPDEQVQGEGQS